jgi:hypothetical protein
VGGRHGGWGQAHDGPSMVSRVVMARGSRVLVGVLLVVVVSLVGAGGAGASSWSVQPVPSPLIALGHLSAVSCSSARFCMAVGSVPLGNVTELWDGSDWTVRSISTPASATLAAVSCSSPTVCVAVGWIGARSTSVALAERWDGIQWSVQPAAPGSGRGDALRGVSCPTATFCVAVGSGVDRPGTKVLVEQWAGSGWSIADPDAGSAASPARPPPRRIVCDTKRLRGGWGWHRRGLERCQLVACSEGQGDRRVLHRGGVQLSQSVRHRCGGSPAVLGSLERPQMGGPANAFQRRARRRRPEQRHVFEHLVHDCD